MFRELSIDSYMFVFGVMSIEGILENDFTLPNDQPRWHQCLLQDMTYG